MTDNIKMNVSDVNTKGRTRFRLPMDVLFKHVVKSHARIN